MPGRSIQHRSSAYRSANRQPLLDDRREGRQALLAHFANDRQFIYAPGYPIPSVFDHFVRMAELSRRWRHRLYAPLIGNAAFTRIARVRGQTGRSLLRDRASFTQAVPRLRARVDRPRAHAGGRHPHVFCRPPSHRHPGTGAAHRRRRAARDRGVGRAAAPRRRRGHALRRRPDGLDQPADQRGPEPLFRRRAHRDQRARPLRVGAAADANARGGVSRDRPAAAPLARDRGSSATCATRSPPRRFDRARGTPSDGAARAAPAEVEREIDDPDRGVHLAVVCLHSRRRGDRASRWPSASRTRSASSRATRQIARGDFDARIVVRSSTSCGASWTPSTAWRPS